VIFQSVINETQIFIFVCVKRLVEVGTRPYRRLNSQRHASAPSKFAAVKFVTFRITWCQLLKPNVSVMVTNIGYFILALVHLMLCQIGARVVLFSQNTAAKTPRVSRFRC